MMEEQKQNDNSEVVERENHFENENQIPNQNDNENDAGMEENNGENDSHGKKENNNEEQENVGEEIPHSFEHLPGDKRKRCPLHPKKRSRYYCPTCNIGCCNRGCHFSLHDNELNFATRLPRRKDQLIRDSFVKTLMIMKK